MNDLDKNKRFLIQNAEGRFSECVGIGESDVAGNFFETLFDPDFSEAAAFHIQGRGGSSGGVDLMAAMYAACIYGFLPENLDTSDPIQTSEEIETDWKSYSQKQIETAAKFAPNGVKALRTYDDVTSYLQSAQMGCVLQMKWFDEFHDAPAGAQLPIPKATSNYTNHAVAVYGVSPLGLQIKAWEIPAYHYVPRSLFPAVFEAAAAFDMNASRWMTYVWVILSYKRWDLLPLLNSARIKKL